MGVERDSLLHLAAKLYYMDDLSQSEVAELVGVSRSQVSRLLARARERGIVRMWVEEYEPRNRVLEEQIANRFRLNHVIVIKTPQGARTGQIRHTVGYFAAPVVSTWIHSHMVIGVAGGRTLYELIRHMIPVQRIEDITVVQLMGNVGPSVSATDAVELSRSLAQRFAGSFYTLNAPAYAPDVYSRDVFLNHEHVRTVWRLFDTMHMALVGIGSLRDSVFIERGVLKAPDLERLRAQGVVGEICGRFFDATGAECSTDYCERVISVGLDDLRKKPEVVGVTIGQDRVEAILAALRGRRITSLVIDDLGATVLLEGAGIP